ncbi:4Fe-4S binding protein [Clostridium oryzae]|uniref:Quinol dehydrogenase membrane component n=1 Tax=Clostridium oryzae TaxID=1450648 RepID=A0A1V4IS97_9CLOT|nr:4Fe-4S binding protein [Clostridium oryzae]OPJ62892.1 quinol dehydrogenase membrane component [Clostridium oryzae]
MNIFLRVWKRFSFIILIAFIIVGLFDMRFAVIAAICMIGPIILSFFKGRFWCGNICPRGSFFDNVVCKFSNDKKTPRCLKSYFFRIIVLTLMMTVFISRLCKTSGDIYGVGRVFYRLIIVTTTIGVAMSLFYNHRTWCNFCPMGTLASAISALSKRKVVLYVSSSCVSCKICEKKCPLGLKPYMYRGSRLSHSDCLQCGRCAAACPQKAIGYHKIKLQIHNIIH